MDGDQVAVVPETTGVVCNNAPPENESYHLMWVVPAVPVTDSATGAFPPAGAPQETPFIRLETLALQLAITSK